ncbi:MAG: hypothetical protein JKY86_06035, partial [Gammaproteobacteria bacterium]|nr:hypothetical protein [Gammaproteobacteria bacterium]
MKSRFLTYGAVTAAVLSLCVTTVKAQEGDYVVPRTEYGQPDLNGVWNFSSFVPMQRPTR